MWEREARVEEGADCNMEKGRSAGGAAGGRRWPLLYFVITWKA